MAFDGRPLLSPSRANLVGSAKLLQYLPKGVLLKQKGKSTNEFYMATCIFRNENIFMYPSAVSNLINHVFSKKLIGHAFRDACSILLPYKYNDVGMRIYDII
jgi:hypothetical protein